MLDAGAIAPSFSLPDQEGNEVALEDFRGSPVVIYFYPKDGTPGCTTQACGIRDDWEAFQKAGAVVLGISPDTVDSHAAFADKYDLPHRILADPDRKVLEEYAAWGIKQRYGKEVEGVIRSTVLVGPDGRVIKVWKQVQPAKHADWVLSALDDLGASRD